MRSIPENRCSVCGRDEAVDVCEGCGVPLCRKCRRMEIWGCGSEDLTVKHFCPACKENPDVNPWGAYENVFGLDEVTDLVNAGSPPETQAFRMKIRLSSGG